MDRVVLGTPIRVSQLFVDENGQPAAPETATLTVGEGEAAVTHTWPWSGDPVDDTIRQSAADPAVLYADILADPVGTMTWVWDPPGLPEQAQVVATKAETFDFVGPDTYDGIRELLGVTKLDVKDEQIEEEPFLPHAELLVRSAVPDWPLLDGEQARTLNRAVMYATAALMAESVAVGGFVGKVRPEAGRFTPDYEKLAKTLWGYYDRLLATAQTDPLAAAMMEGGVAMIAIGGPTRRRKAGYGDLLGTLGPVDPMSG